MEKVQTDYSLYLCTDQGCIGERNFYQVVEHAIQGGCSVVQLREKKCSTREFLQTAKRIKAITKKYNIPLIINDRIDICLAADAEGVHLGLQDMPVAEARRLLGDKKIIGCSAHSLTEACQAKKEGADYLGVGAVFATDTKKDAVTTSLDTLKEICQKINLPVVAIGGVKEDNADLLRDTGIAGIAVISAIMADSEPRKAAERLKRILNSMDL
ncbi:MAG: thiamine phosphate synthase [Lachnospiraceae bacterium]|nr:thiamine phosphate synthase [Lachnospiraceae bacterium]